MNEIGEDISDKVHRTIVTAKTADSSRKGIRREREGSAKGRKFPARGSREPLLLLRMHRARVESAREMWPYKERGQELAHLSLSTR